MLYDVRFFVLSIFGKVNDFSKQEYNALYCVAKCPNLGRV